ncbi:hypothetical protein GLYMA_U031724v4 [Glycine max]|nr:hypothetical protein GLYMA_U031724v4 [Glycine max]KAH1127652.1 hypothetical protein GYH30_016295 [Glycine max]
MSGHYCVVVGVLPRRAMNTDLVLTPSVTSSQCATHQEITGKACVEIRHRRSGTRDCGSRSPWWWRSEGPPWIDTGGDIEHAGVVEGDNKDEEVVAEDEREGEDFLFKKIEMCFISLKKEMRSVLKDEG